MTTETNPDNSPSVSVVDAPPTPAELKIAFRALAAEIGPRCKLSISVAPEHSDRLLWACCYPKGYGSKVGAPSETFSVYVDTWANLLSEIRAEWAKLSTNSRAQTIRDMALAIIRITADLGQCTDAALRTEFDPSDVERYGEDAVAQANDMAELGPFEIIATSGANAEAA
jgi:hypothetical protein